MPNFPTSNIPRTAIKFANAVFIFGIVFSILIAIYAIYRINHPIFVNDLEDEAMHDFYYICILIAGFFSILFSLGLRKLSNDLKLNISIVLISVSIAIYACESVLEVSRRQKLSNQTAVDDKMEFLKGLNESGIAAYSTVYPLLFVYTNGLNAATGNIYPLGGISNIPTINSNELGFYPIIETDEHGFNNPRGLYKENNVAVVLIGDSFTEGCCVNSNETIAAVMRELGVNSISFGKGGNGPLIEFASLMEYAKPIRPKLVVWVYYPNDLPNLRFREMNSSILKNYLYEKDFTQNLISRQDEIDSVLINYFDNERGKYVRSKENQGANEAVSEEGRIANSWPIRILKLYNLRSTFKLEPRPSFENALRMFEEILEKSQNTVNGWGGELVFVYLPENGTYKDQFRDDVLRTVDELNIPIIDVYIEVFSSHPDPLSLFPRRNSSNHYNAKGYRLIAEAIVKRLKSDGFIR